MNLVARSTPPWRGATTTVVAPNPDSSLAIPDPITPAPTTPTRAKRGRGTTGPTVLSRRAAVPAECRVLAVITRDPERLPGARRRTIGTGPHPSPFRHQLPP